jgi:hypothetical protein
LIDDAIEEAGIQDIPDFQKYIEEQFELSDIDYFKKLYKAIGIKANRKENDFEIV